MDVKKAISELRAERADIDRAILILERSNRVSTATAVAAAHSVTEIGEFGERHGGSFRGRAGRGQIRELSL
jgi:hypothetical protein